MNRKLGLLVAAVGMLAMACQSADAGGRRHRIDPGVKAAAVGVGIGSTLAFLSLNDWKWSSSWDTRRSHGLTTGGAYVATSIGCMAVSPMVATAFVRRPLTHREAHVLMGSCIIPIVGGLLVNAVWDAHPEWERFDAPPAPARRRR